MIKVTYSLINILILLTMFFCSTSYAAPNSVSGKITSLLASANDPAIRITGNVSPTQCLTDKFGWLSFQGTPAERNILYSSAVALSVAGYSVDVYTNIDGTACRIVMIQALGLNP